MFVVCVLKVDEVSCLSSTTGWFDVDRWRGLRIGLCYSTLNSLGDCKQHILWLVSLYRKIRFYRLSTIWRYLGFFNEFFKMFFTVNNYSTRSPAFPDARFFVGMDNVNNFVPCYVFLMGTGSPGFRKYFYIINKFWMYIWKLTSKLGTMNSLNILVTKR